MTSRFPVAVAEAFSKSLEPFIQHFADAGVPRAMVDSFVNDFFDRLKPITAAWKAEEKSRKIAVAEVRPSIEDALSQYWHNNDGATSKEVLDGEFWFTVRPWLERAEK